MKKRKGEEVKEQKIKTVKGKPRAKRKVLTPKERHDRAYPKKKKN